MKEIRGCCPFPLTWMPPHVPVSSRRASHRKLPSPKSIFNHHNSRASPKEQHKPCPQPSNLTFPSLSLDFLPSLSPQQNPPPPPPLAFPSSENYLHIRAPPGGCAVGAQCPHTCYTLTTALGPVGRPFLRSEMPTEIYLLAPLPWMHPKLRGFKEKALQTQPKVQTL